MPHRDHADLGRGFWLLWAASAVSQVGSQVTAVALPLTAVGVLGAGAAEMGLLVALGVAPALLFGLVAGAWVDRLRRRPVLIAADLGRAVLLASVPASALIGVLGMTQLYVVAFLSSTFTVWFNVASESFVPSLVDRDQLVEANGRLGTVASASMVIGPGLAGALIQAISAPVAVAADALSFVLSAMLLGRVTSPETSPPRAARGRLRVEVGEGLRFLWAQPVLRAIACGACLNNLAASMAGAVFVLYQVREIGLDAAAVGLVAAALGAGSVVGALVAGRLTRALGIGPTMLGATALAVAARACAPLAATAPGAALLLLVCGQACIGGAFALLNVPTSSLRQAVVPDRLRGRVGAGSRTVSQAATPIGALLGGFLGERLGLAPTLWVAAALSVLVVAAVAASPIPALRAAPQPVPEPATT